MKNRIKKLCCLAILSCISIFLTASFQCLAEKWDPDAKEKALVEAVRDYDLAKTAKEKQAVMDRKADYLNFGMSPLGPSILRYKIIQCITDYKIGEDGRPIALPVDYRKALKICDELRNMYNEEPCATFIYGEGARECVSRPEAYMLMAKAFIGLGDTLNAKTSYLKVLKDYYDSKMQGWEWDSTYGRVAVDNLNELGKNSSLSDSDLMEFTNEIIDACPDTTVKAKVLYADARYFQEKGNTTAAASNCYRVIKEFSDTLISRYDEDPLYYAFEAADILKSLSKTLADRELRDILNALVKTHGEGIVPSAARRMFEINGYSEKLKKYLELYGFVNLEAVNRVFLDYSDEKKLLNDLEYLKRAKPTYRIKADGAFKEFGKTINRFKYSENRQKKARADAKQMAEYIDSMLQKSFTQIDWPNDPFKGNRKVLEYYGSIEDAWIREYLTDDGGYVVFHDRDNGKNTWYFNIQGYDSNGLQYALYGK
jgi:hypothetical protein